MDFFRRVGPKARFGLKRLRNLLFLAPLFFASCGTPYMGKELYGADEFVLDSYKIREGKFSILEMEGEPLVELSEDLLDEYQDRIHEDDVLQVAVYHPKREDISKAVHGVGQTIGYRVMNGKVNLPDLPPVHVKDLTLCQAMEKIQNKYLEQIEDIEVFLTYKDRIARKVELAGLVAIPSIPVDGRIRLFDVLSKAKVPPEANLFKSYVIRDRKPLPVDLYKLLKEGDMNQNIVMHGGDKIYIAEPSAANLMVLGEVNCEKVVNLPHGYMSLREALAMAGGVPFTGDKSYIQVIRGNVLRPKIYVLNWQHIIHLPNDSLLLMPGDIVYVTAKPITEWNRFVSQLIPSTTWFQLLGNECRTWGVFIP